MKINVLSDSDIEILKRIVEKEKKGLIGGRYPGEKNWSPEDDQNTPEVYVAIPPTTGIPALEFTGTNGPGEGDTPGEAECEIYQLIDDGTNPPTLLPMDVGTKTVYNIRTAAISGESEWIVVHRSKTGAWIAANSSSERVRECRFQIVSSDPLTLTAIGELLSWDWGFNVQDVQPQMGIPPLYLGTVELCDPSGCYLSEPADDLFARVGTARLRAGRDGTTCRTTDTGTGTGTGTVTADGDTAIWEISSLCCKQYDCDVDG